MQACIKNIFEHMLHVPKSHELVYIHELIPVKAGVKSVSLHKFVTKKNGREWRSIREGLDGGGVCYSLFIKNSAHYSSH